jgi:PKD repeat protein
VTVGGTAVTSFTVVSDTEITATTPAISTAEQVDVLVTTPSGTSSSIAGDKYTFAATATTVPLPMFSASPTSGTAPLVVTFTDESTDSPATWDWDFGDGNTSTLQNPTNTYANDGTYTVSLTEENSIGTNATTMTGYIVVGATIPTAAFTASSLTGSAPLTVQFTDSSTGSPTSWVWDFGDGSTGTAQNPSHEYTTAGTYTVSLTATNAEGSSTNTASQTITVGSAAMATYTTAPTFAVAAQATTTSSVDNWLAQQQAIATATPTHKSPGYDLITALIGFGIVAGIALYRRR